MKIKRIEINKPSCSEVNYALETIKERHVVEMLLSEGEIHLVGTTMAGRRLSVISKMKKYRKETCLRGDLISAPLINWAYAENNDAPAPEGVKIVAEFPEGSKYFFSHIMCTLIGKNELAEESFQALIKEKKENGWVIE